MISSKALTASQHEVRLSDVVPLETTLPFYQADVRQEGALNKAADGVEVILHTPAYHGIHSGTRTEKEFYDLNITGTFHMFQAAVLNKVRRVVWMSSGAVFGNGWYGYTKKIGEQMCEYFHQKHGIEVIMLRPSGFVPPRDVRHYGEKMLNIGVDHRDVLQAVVLAVETDRQFGAYRIVRQDPFTLVDRQEYSKAPIEVWEKAYPGAREIIENYNLKLPVQLSTADQSIEQSELGYQPRYNFGTFIQEFTADGKIREDLFYKLAL
jgi:nucleoside-diphosphate-sugar epimerase